MSIDSASRHSAKIGARETVFNDRSMIRLAFLGRKFQKFLLSNSFFLIRSQLTHPKPEIC